MLLSSFFPEGIPFLNIEPNSLARNSIPPIPSLLEENDTEKDLLGIPDRRKGRSKYGA